MIDLNAANALDKKIQKEIGELEEKIKNTDDVAEKTKHEFRIAELLGKHKKIMDDYMASNN